MFVMKEDRETVCALISVDEDDTFSLNEMKKLKKEIRRTGNIPSEYEFFIWDIIGLFGCDFLSRKRREQIEYLYAQGTDKLVELAKQVKKGD